MSDCLLIQALRVLPMRTPEALAVVLMYLSAALALPCEEARLLCLYRTGCANAMQSYLWKCTSSENGCPEHCQHALIALTSTPEGKQLMTVSKQTDYSNTTSKTRLTLVSSFFWRCSPLHFTKVKESLAKS